MHILFLGPPCSSIENALHKSGHTFFRTEESLTINFLEKHHFDFGVSYRFKHIIRQNEISWFAGKLINLHISYLPWNRGADPNLWSWLENTPKGITIHKIDTGCDTGDILLQKYVSFDSDKETLRSSYEALSCAIENLFIENMHALFTEILRPQPQIGQGSFHYAKSKTPFLHLIENFWWETPVKELQGFSVSNCVRERERERTSSRKI